jgi:hypothetical protein
VLPVATPDCPKDGEEPKPKALVGVPNEVVVEVPKPGALLTPNAAVPEDPKPGVVVEPKVVEPNGGVPVAPNKDVDVEPPKAGVVVVPKLLLPNVGCVCCTVLPNGVDWLGDEPKPPKLGFCPNRDPEKFAE